MIEIFEENNLAVVINGNRRSEFEPELVHKYGENRLKLYAYSRMNSIMGHLEEGFDASGYFIESQIEYLKAGIKYTFDIHDPKNKHDKMEEVLHEHEQFYTEEELEMIA